MTTQTPQLQAFFTNPANVGQDKLFGFTFDQESEIGIMFKRIICKDGFSFSCQADYSKYCTPRITFYCIDSFEYSRMELGYPSASDDLIIEFADQKEIPTKTVYPYVPVEIIEQLITKHGGIDTDKYTIN